MCPKVEVTGTVERQEPVRLHTAKRTGGITNSIHSKVQVIHKFCG